MRGVAQAVTSAHVARRSIALANLFDCLQLCLGFICHLGYDDPVRWLVRLGRTCRAVQRLFPAASSAELWCIYDESNNDIPDAIEKVGLGDHIKQVPKL